MARGKIRKENKEIPYADQFAVTDDFKLKMTLAAIADKYDEKTRDFIKRCYEDSELAVLYAQLRHSNDNHTGKGEARRREVIRFPNMVIYDFIDTVMSDLYGEEWMQDNKAMKHELLLPWYTIPFNKL